MAPENLTGRDTIDQKIIEILNENALLCICRDRGKFASFIGDMKILCISSR